MDETIWSLDPHGRAKHLILQRHLDAWLPIMTRSFPKLVYIDGFAGPGIYTGGEPGSPIVALRAAKFNTRLTNAPPTSEVGFLFIEERADRHAVLKQQLKTLDPLPRWVKCHAVRGEFESVMSRSFDRLSLGGRRPMFVFVDPFGYSGLPMSLMARISRVPHSECLINYTYKSINRWAARGDTRKDAHVDSLYGSPHWRQYRGDDNEMVEFYRQQLRSEAGFKYVCSFKMKDQNGVTEYFLAFATNDAKGLTVMKNAMWKADPQTGRVFSDADDEDQLFLDVPLEPLDGLLVRQFTGAGWVLIDAVEEFVRHTHYSESKHLRRQTLRPLEEQGRLLAERPPNKRVRAGEYPLGTRLLFKS